MLEAHTEYVKADGVVVATDDEFVMRNSTKIANKPLKLKKDCQSLGKAIPSPIWERSDPETQTKD